MSELSPDLIDRLSARAHDPMRRTADASIQANARPMDLGQVMADFQQHAPPQAQGLFGALDNLQGLLGGSGGGFAMMGPGGPVSFGQAAGSQPPAERASEAELAEAQRAIGRPLPAEVRQLYAIADGGFGPGGGLFPIAELVARYRELTSEPYGPNGEDWPANLVPLFGQNPQLLCIDAATGEILLWDPEELEEETAGAWKRSFKREAATLAQLLEQWLGEPTLEERMEQERKAAYANVPQATIDFYARMSPEERAEYGFEGDDWEAELRRRFAAGPA
jgi:hypothetical protein